MIRGLDHINISTDRLAETVAFFRDILGLTEGWRPDFGFPGAWLYAGDTAVVHLVEFKEAKRPSREAALDHFAFRIDDYDAVLKRVQAAGIKYQAVDIPNSEIRQINIRDPNGANVELNYRPDGPPPAVRKAKRAAAATA
ncbi:MAG TPA: VOC family protein [Caulobacteraceae bacterium]|nr:VOC family protein [Caulobacteraceae bacterium]